MDKQPRWVYINGMHAIGIGYPVHRVGEYAGHWGITVLPDWMSQGFIDSLPAHVFEDPFDYVQIVIPPEQLTMGEGVKTFEMVEGFEPITGFQHPNYRRILLDGVLIWGREEYPGERQIVIPKVKIPKKLREGIPVLEGGEE